MSANASLTIVGGPQAIEPGQTTTLTAQIVNLGTVPDDFRLSVRQLDPAWVVFRPPTVFLQPGAQATAEIVITPPASVAPALLQPIFRLLSRRAGNIAIVEIAMPAPQPMAPIYEAPSRPAHAPPRTASVPAPTATSDEEPAWDDDEADTGEVAIAPVRAAPRRDNSAFLVRLLVALIVVLLLLTIGVFALNRQTSTPTPTPASAAESTVPTTGVPPTVAGDQPTATVTPNATPPTATAGFVPRKYIVANTGGQGVYLRRTASMGDRDTAYADDTVLVQIGPDVQADGITWHNVRAPDGKIGFVPAQFTSVAP